MILGDLDEGERKGLVGSEEIENLNLNVEKFYNRAAHKNEVDGEAMRCTVHVIPVSQHHHIISTMKRTVARRWQ